MHRTDTGTVRPPGSALALDVPLAVVVAWVMWIGAQAGHAHMWSGGPPWSRGGGPPDFDGFTWWLWPVPFVVAAAVGVVVRRISPRIGFAVVVAATTGYLAIGAAAPPALLAPMLCVHALAGRLPVRRWLPYGLCLLALPIAALWRLPALGLAEAGTYGGLLLGAACLTVSALLALLRVGRRESQRQRHDEEMRRVAYEERLRLAREMHDVVGHSLSVISMQAGVALHVLESRPDQVGVSLEAIRTSSRDALAELRHTLGVFRDPDQREPLSPAPGIARIDELAGALRAAGRRVSVERGSVDPTTVSTGLQQTAFRIAQEALTNVVRHTEGAGALVRVSTTDGSLVVSVEDDGPVLAAPPREGNGLHGMRERVAAVGGTLDIAPRPRGGLSVRAVLPLPRDPGADDSSTDETEEPR